MSDNVKIVIEIPAELYSRIKGGGGWTCLNQCRECIENGIPLDDVKAEIEKQIEIDFAFAETETLKVPCHYGIANGLQNAIRFLDNIGKAENIDSNDVTHIFDGVTEIPKDAFKGWTTEELLRQARAESEDKK